MCGTTTDCQSICSIGCKFADRSRPCPRTDRGLHGGGAIPADRRHAHSKRHEPRRASSRERYRFCECGTKSCGIDERRVAPGVLVAPVTRVPHHTDDREPSVGICRSRTAGASRSRLDRPEPPRHGLVDDGDRHGGRRVVPVEDTSTHAAFPSPGRIARHALKQAGCPRRGSGPPSPLNPRTALADRDPGSSTSRPPAPSSRQHEYRGQPCRTHYVAARRFRYLAWGTSNPRSATGRLPHADVDLVEPKSLAPGVPAPPAVQW